MGTGKRCRDKSGQMFFKAFFTEGCHQGSDFITAKTFLLEFQNSLPEGLRSLLMEENACLDAFQGAAFGKSDHRRSAGLGLERHNPEIFFRGKNQGLRARVKFLKFRVRKAAQERNFPALAKLFVKPGGGTAAGNQEPAIERFKSG